MRASSPISFLPRLLLLLLGLCCGQVDSKGLLPRDPQPDGGGQVRGGGKPGDLDAASDQDGGHAPGPQDGPAADWMAVSDRPLPPPPDQASGDVAAADVPQDSGGDARCADPVPCGKCGGTIQCSGACSIATPANHGQVCGRCSGVIQCDGSCSKPTPANHGQSCGRCGGVVTCTGGCSVEDPPALGQACGNAGVVQCNGACKGPLFRLWNRTTADHLYTMSRDERERASQNGYVFEQVACQLFEGASAGTAPLYRLYQPSSGDHFYTIAAAERNRALSQLGFVDEGVAGYVFPTAAPGTVPLHRLFHGGNGDHFYTVSAEERARAVGLGYVEEGVAAHVFPP